MKNDINRAIADSPAMSPPSTDVELWLRVYDNSLVGIAG